MFRGTTPTEIYTIKNRGALDLSKCEQIWVTIVDRGAHAHTYDIDRLTIDATAGTISLALTQEETLAFSVGAAYAQLRFLYIDGTAFASRRVNFEIEDVKRGGVIE